MGILRIVAGITQHIKIAIYNRDNSTKESSNNFMLNSLISLGDK